MLLLAHKPCAEQEPTASSAGAIKNFLGILEDAKKIAHIANKFDSRDKTVAGNLLSMLMICQKVV